MFLDDEEDSIGWIGVCWWVRSRVQQFDVLCLINHLKCGWRSIINGCRSKISMDRIMSIVISTEYINTTCTVGGHLWMNAIKSSHMKFSQMKSTSEVKSSRDSRVTLFYLYGFRQFTILE